MSTWNDPKTDWQGGETPTNADVNRWEGNAQYLNEHKLSTENRSVQLRHLPTSDEPNCVLRVNSANADPQYGQVETKYIADGAVTEAKIANGAVTAGKIGSAAVTEAKLAADAVVSGKIKDEAVTNAKIASNAVTRSKIANTAVGEEKLASDVKSKFSSYVNDTKEDAVSIEDVGSIDVDYLRYGQIVMVNIFKGVVPASAVGKTFDIINGSDLPFVEEITPTSLFILSGGGYIEKSNLEHIPLIVSFNTHNKEIEVWEVSTGGKYKFETGDGFFISLTYMIKDQNAQV